jgi:hypothetical protein
MEMVADTLRVSRSQRHSHFRPRSRTRGRHQKTADAEVLAATHALTDV